MINVGEVDAMDAFNPNGTREGTSWFADRIAMPIRWRALVLDDDQDSLDSLIEFLGAYLPELRVESYSDPTLGLRAINVGAYDIIIVDYRMPKFDGIQVLQAASLRQPQALRVLITANASVPAAASLPADVSAHLVLLKPLHTQPFIDILRRLLENKDGNVAKRITGASKL